MTEEDIKTLAQLEKRLILEKQRHDRLVRDLRMAKQQLEKKCDHRYPDGASALDNGFLHSHCRICYATN